MIYIGSDHAGFEYKQEIKEYLLHQGNKVEDLGAHSNKPSHYPQYAKAVAEKVSAHKGSLGILFCRSGQGMAMAANRVKGARASIAWNEQVAAGARNHNDSNILSIPADYVTIEEAKKIISVFISTSASKEARHVQRIAMLDQ
ncbi:MAG TPA: RpiB/LacA/LacB family sugar-phosphate isomerase [bacterium]|jgi:ribose 5-phosphate isomerase B|nr:RpiB/LacA/LacB family sugar-phosphate isomerase [bacterium]HOR57060.1 RpiB/LacA/LacB family sugar-phosphate isomerase [bacterium]HPL55947.1 RpiB/LacA/LacB family sugar-phosphate isomerase [bacterium]HPM27737.1 RpiB/LacA/LacB family sugar-phosphate isomerase [bacterium]